MLALRTREEKDPRTIGQLFYPCWDELEDIRFAEEMIQFFLDNLFRDIPAFLKRAFNPADSSRTMNLAAA